MMPQTRRLAVAASVILLVLAACALSGFLAQLQSDRVSSVPQTRTFWEGGDAQDLPESLYERITGMSTEEVDVPAQVRDEVTGGLQESLLQTCSNNTVGLLFTCSREQAAGQVSGRLAERGWVLLSGDPAGQGATFVKSRGHYRWLFMQVVGVGNNSTVVLSLQDGENDYAQ